jgi:hypothetical protein
MTEVTLHDWPISDEMEARINHWHKKVMPHLLARDEDETPVCVPSYSRRPYDNDSPELTELLEEITNDIGPWLASLPNEDMHHPLFGGPANIYFGPDHATLMIGGIDYYLPLELEAA